MNDSTSGNRFVVLQHRPRKGDTRPDHWDLMFELNGELETWALAEVPKIGTTINATRLPRHRLAYLDYEGPISGNRGEVVREMVGTYDGVLDLENASQGFDVTIDGTHGRFRIWLCKQSDECWIVKITDA